MSNILTIRSDSEEVSLAIYDNNTELVSRTWKAGRELSVQISAGIKELCESVRLTVFDVDGIIVYEGPGSYTGLRISISVVNALGYSLEKPVIGASGDDWLKYGFEKLKSTTKFKPVQPIYGGDVYTTKPKK